MIGVFGSRRQAKLFLLRERVPTKQAGTRQQRLSQAQQARFETAWEGVRRWLASDPPDAGRASYDSDRERFNRLVGPGETPWSRRTACYVASTSLGTRSSKWCDTDPAWLDLQAPETGLTVPFRAQELGYRVRYLRKQLGWTQGFAAEQARVAQSTISKCERAVQLAHAFGLSVE